MNSPCCEPKEITNATYSKGFALITTLVLLTMLSILALSQISSNSTQTKMATNAADTEISFEKTEGAVSEATNKMINSTYTSEKFLQNGSGLYVFNKNTAPLWHTSNWDSSAFAIEGFAGLAGTKATYMIEQLPSVVQPGQNLRTMTRIYRITGRTTGQSGLSSVLIQSTLQIQR